MLQIHGPVVVGHNCITTEVDGFTSSSGNLPAMPAPFSNIIIAGDGSKRWDEIASLNTGEVRARSELGIAKSHRSAHLSSAMFWKAVTGLACLLGKLERALTISLYLSISF